MTIEDSKPKTIYRNEVNGKVLYSIGLSHKKQDGTWENGYMSCRFPKDANIENKTKILLHNAWLDFYVQDKKTHTYIFINKYEVVEKSLDEELLNEVPQNTKSEYDSEQSDITLTDEDLPF